MSNENLGSTVIAFMRDGLIQKVISTHPTQFILLDDADGEPGADQHITIDGTSYHIWSDENTNVAHKEVLEIKKRMLEQDIGELTEEDFSIFNTHFRVKAHAMGLAYLVIGKEKMTYENEEMYGQDKYVIIESKVPGQRMSFRVELEDNQWDASEYIVRYFAFLAKHFNYDGFALKDYLNHSEFPASSIESLITVTG